jgi:cyanophycinase
MQRRLAILPTLVLVLGTLNAWGGDASESPAPEYGPAKGTLVIVGGGPTTDTGIMEKFIELAGGPNARFVIVPTAGGNKTPKGAVKEYAEEKVIAPWKKRGLTHVRMLHTHDPNIADTEEFVQPLREANAVWFDGGRQWHIVDSYMNTLAYKEFHRVLERGGVIAGSSAGATIQGDYLVRGAIGGPDIVMTPEKEHEHGFNFLRKTAIDQHINTRNRWDDLTPVIKKYPNLLGIGLAEGTAIVVKGDRFEVMGAWKVAVHDNQRLYQPWEKPYYVLSAGDVYNMKTRSIEKFGDGDIRRRKPAPPSGAKKGNE